MARSFAGQNVVIRSFELQPRSGERSYDNLLQPRSGERSYDSLLQPRSGERSYDNLLQPRSGERSYANVATTVCFFKFRRNSPSYSFS